MLEIEVGHCYCQRNPLWGRGIARINRQVHSSVLDFERFDTTLIFTSNGLEVQEHQIQPATIFTHTGYEPIDEGLFHKLFAMAKMVKAAACAKLATCHEPIETNEQAPGIEGYMASKHNNDYAVISIMSHDSLLTNYKVERFDFSSGLKQEECELSAQRIIQEQYYPIQESTFVAIKDLWTKTQQEVDTLLRNYHVIDDTPMQSYAEAYARGMKNLLDGVYDVVDVHK